MDGADGARIADGKDAATALMADAERDRCAGWSLHLIDGRGPDDAVVLRRTANESAPSALVHPQFGRHR